MSWSFIDSTKYDTGGTTATIFAITLPSYTSGDVCIITAYKDQDLGDWSISTAGWNLLSTDRATTGRDRSTTIFYKVLGSSETNPTIEYSDSTSEEISWMAHVFRSTDTLSMGYIINDWAYMSNQNDPTPPNPSAIATQDNCLGIVINMQTHDDITAPGAPTNYTLANSIYGSSDDNRQQFLAYDLDVGVAGTISPGSWTHSFNNSVSEYSTYTLILGTMPAIGVNSVDGDTQMDYGDIDEILFGFGFGAVQGTGTVEIASSSDYNTATKVDQMVTNWNDVDITFDTMFGSLSDGTLYIFVTNDNGDRTSGIPINKGEATPLEIVLATGPDIFHTMDNTYDDATGNGFSANGQTSLGSFGFDVISGVRNAVRSWSVNDDNSRIEMADSIYTNQTNTHKMRYIGGWIYLDRVHLIPSGIYEEGGGVNNLYFVIGYGNILLANVADSNKNFKIQAFSDMKLASNRWYHVMMFFEDATTLGEFGLYIDGIKQSKTDGNPLTSTSGMSVHSGDWSYGKPDANLDTGGTDITYPSAPKVQIQYFGTWSQYGGGAPLSQQTIRNELFAKCVNPVDVLITSIESTMQQAVDTGIAPVTYGDVPCGMKVQRKTGGGNLLLTFNDIVFNDRGSIDVLWMGTSGETLTIINNGTSNTKSSKCVSPYGGSINIIEPSRINITGVIDGSKIVVLDSSDNSVIDSIESSLGDFIVSVLAANIHVMIIADDYITIQKFDVSVSGDSIIPIVQERDYSYQNN